MVGSDGVLPLPWLAPWLEEALRTQRGHAVLIHGPQGIGQWQLSLTLAQAWLCEGAQGARRPCGTCASCRLVQARSHPDLLVLIPEALQAPLGWMLADSEGEGAEVGGKKQPSKEIKVEAVRGAVAFAQTTPAREAGKVVVLHPAERMNGIAANALLKTLEEPAGSARFILSCSAPEALLPTIRSRCQAFALPLPEAQAAAAWLAEQGVAQPQIVLAAAGGQPLDALERVREGVDARLWQQLPVLMQRGDAAAMTGWPIPRAVDALQKLCHDVACVSVGAAPRFYPAQALPQQAETARLLAWSRELARAARHAEHPLNAGLAIEALVAQAQRALATPAPERPARRSVSVHSAG
ncbi:MAG: DNA polymerase III subunit delta' [Piscinibacter sp.]|uniref:DNA polymerase III subunit delta' n=1 Tax=Piscinibacter sp. TaxID=1903157 RepID=UPI001B3EF487|nr:DNA polymerase III subunit delta' [Piscinibacter sp.]MBP5990703.1 DNA polymerase III subunit delta' [Piscinibacter sp.]MBP6028825.1 DNA polymerase III subunit delta' [Piscinibacter sp.]